MIKLTLTLLLLCVFSSCGSLNIEKRKYTQGFYHSSSKSNQKVEKTLPFNISERKDKIENSSLAITEEKIESEPIIIDSTFKDTNENCDTLVLKNGDVLAVNILEQTDSTLRYNMCEGEDYSEKNISNASIKYIKYRHGEFDVSKDKAYTKNKKEEDKKGGNLFVKILLMILVSIVLTISAGMGLVLVWIFTSGIFLGFLTFLVVSFSFYIFLLLIKNLFKGKGSPCRNCFLFSMLFGLPFGIVCYFIFK